jgi:aminoglycoside phosphotransferase (APT) family kinase protein
VVKALAKFHAETFKTTAFPSIERHNNEAQVTGMQPGFSAGWPVVKTLFPELISEQAGRLAPRLPDYLPALLDAITADPICISHGDMRLDNIFLARITLRSLISRRYQNPRQNMTLPTF